MHILEPTITRTAVYIDESAQETEGFVVSAFVFCREDISKDVSHALRSAGLVPGKDEFKSGAYMAASPALQGLRDGLIGVAVSKARLAFLVSSTSLRDNLGRDILGCLADICAMNQVDPSLLDVFVDQGLVRSVAETREFARRNLSFVRTRLHIERDSKEILGIQVADAVAHTLGQVIKQDLILRPKTIYFGPDEGYPEGTPVGLGDALLVRLRYSFFTRPGDGGPDPPLFGWGAFVTPTCPYEVRRLVEMRFENIWLGCMH